MLGKRYSSGDGITTTASTATGGWFASDIECPLRITVQNFRWAK
jgi:hypothetical protein